MSRSCRLLVCGGGNGAHVLTALGAADPDTETRVLTLYKDEAETWSNSLKEHDFTVHFDLHGKELTQLKNKPDLVSKDPSIAKGCNLVVFVVPAFGHVQYLEAIKPFIDPGTTLVGLPGQAGFEFDVHGILGEVAKDCTLANFESLPWACRIKEYGKDVEVLGTKACLAGAYEPGRIEPSLEHPKEVLQRILGEHPQLDVQGHILGMTMMAVNAYVHPAILYGRWHNYNDEHLQEPPLFYQGIDEHAASTMSGLSNEVLASAAAIMKNQPDVDLSNVHHISEWYLKCYGEEIKDKSTLYTSIFTNEAYIGLTHPMKQAKTEGSLVPDFGHRYFTEDVPYGLAVLKGIAEVAGVSTPVMDKVLCWMQSKLGREYIKGNTISGKDVTTSRAPQRYGFNTVNALLGKE